MSEEERVQLLASEDAAGAGEVRRAGAEDGRRRRPGCMLRAAPSLAAIAPDDQPLHPPPSSSPCAPAAPAWAADAALPVCHKPAASHRPCAATVRVEVRQPARRAARWLLLGFLLVQALLFVGFFLRFYRQPTLRRAAGLGLCVAKGFAGTLYVSVPVLFLSMCRYTQAALLPSWLGHLQLRRLSSRRVHHAAAVCCTVASCGHAAAHLLGTFPRLAALPRAAVLAMLGLASQPSPSTAGLRGHLGQGLHPANASQTLTTLSETSAPFGYHNLLWHTRAGWTGVLLLACLAAMAITALPVVRRRHFELFFSVHNLSLLFALLAMVHGTQALLQPPLMWGVLAVPAGWYLAERVFRCWQGRDAAK